jgi:predicted transcriptional regulator
MASGETQLPSLPEGLMAEIEKIAREQERSVSEVLAEAVDRYVRDRQWDAVKQYGQARASERGLTEGDVPRLISEYRSERSR